MSKKENPERPARKGRRPRPFRKVLLRNRYGYDLRLGHHKPFRKVERLPGAYPALFLGSGDPERSVNCHAAFPPGAPRWSQISYRRRIGPVRRRFLATKPRWQRASKSTRQRPTPFFRGGEQQSK